MANLFGPYEIQAQLGVGGMATVYQALDARDGKTVALKVLHDNLARDAEVVKRFQQEARIADRLHHVNIIRVYEFGVAEGRPFLSMEFLAAGSLARAFKQPRVLTLQNSLSLLSQIAAALDYAHEQGVVHRDLKFENILLRDKNQLVLSDFGIAKLVEGTNMTATGQMMGTPNYMSPEQILNRNVDYRTDLYALGVMAYLLLTGYFPFRSDNPLVVIHKHLTTPAPLPTSINPQLPPALNGLLLKALAKDPKERYASAGEFMRSLKGELMMSQAAAFQTSINMFGRLAGDEDVPPDLASIAPPRPAPRGTGPLPPPPAPRGTAPLKLQRQPVRRWNPWVFGSLTMIVALGGLALVMIFLVVGVRSVGTSHTATPNFPTATAGSFIVGRASPTPLIPTATAGSFIVGLASPTPAEGDAPPVIATGEASPTPNERATLLASAATRESLLPTPIGGGSGEVAYLLEAFNNFDIYIIKVADGKARQLVSNPANDFDLAWSSTGQSLAFVRVSENAPIASLYVLDMPTQRLRQLTSGTAYRSPSWSPDGASLSASLWRGERRIIVQTSDWSGTPQDLGTGVLARWSPDGTQLAFQVDMTPASDLFDLEQTAISDIFIMNRDGSGRRNLTNHVADDAWVVWSPDGQWLTFNSNRTGNWDIFAMRPDGSDLVNLTDHPADDLFPSWSPDSLHLVFTSNRDGDFDLYLREVSGAVQRLSNEDGAAWAPVWRP